MSRILCAALTLLLIVPSISSAEIKIFTHTVKQPFAGSQSPDDARVAAIHKAKREVLEKAGTYLEGLTVVKNSVVEKDEIIALSAGVLKAEVVSQENFATKEALGIVVVAKVDVDTSILDERIRKLLKDRELLKKYQEVQKREKELLAKIVQLEKENRRLQTSPASEDTQNKEELKKKFKDATQGLTAVEWYKKALALWKNGKYTNPGNALECLNKAISLDSNLGSAYNDRANSWYDKGKYDRAISDYNKAIELNPRHDSAYYNRGLARGNRGKYDRAISDFNKAIELNPRHASAYHNRGLAWGNKDKYDRAISDFNKAIRLNPRHASAYNNRGSAWGKKGKYDRAISDFNKTIELNPRYIEAYNNRGLAWHSKKDYFRACSDYNKVCELGDCDVINWAKKKGVCE